MTHIVRFGDVPHEGEPIDRTRYLEDTRAAATTFEHHIAVLREYDWSLPDERALRLLHEMSRAGVAYLDTLRDAQPGPQS